MNNNAAVFKSSSDNLECETMPSCSSFSIRCPLPFRPNTKAMKIDTTLALWTPELIEQYCKHLVGDTAVTCNVTSVDAASNFKSLHGNIHLYNKYMRQGIIKASSCAIYLLLVRVFTILCWLANVELNNEMIEEGIDILYGYQQANSIKCAALNKARRRVMQDTEFIHELHVTGGLKEFCSRITLKCDAGSIFDKFYKTKTIHEYARRLMGGEVSTKYKVSAETIQGELRKLDLELEHSQETKEPDDIIPIFHDNCELMVLAQVVNNDYEMRIDEPPPNKKSRVTIESIISQLRYECNNKQYNSILTYAHISGQKFSELEQRALKVFRAAFHGGMVSALISNKCYTSILLDAQQQIISCGLFGIDQARNMIIIYCFTTVKEFRGRGYARTLMFYLRWLRTSLGPQYKLMVYALKAVIPLWNKFHFEVDKYAQSGFKGTVTMVDQLGQQEFNKQKLDEVIQRREDIAAGYLLIPLSGIDS
jgi:hypothetical protein